MKLSFQVTIYGRSVLSRGARSTPLHSKEMAQVHES